MVLAKEDEDGLLPPSLALICGVEVFELGMGGGTRGPQTHVPHDAVDVVGEDDWETVTGLDIDMEELEDEGSVVGLGVKTSCCCKEVVNEEALRRTRLVPAAMKISASCKACIT